MTDKISNGGTIRIQITPKASREYPEPPNEFFKWNSLSRELKSLEVSDSDELELQLRILKVINTFSENDSVSKLPSIFEVEFAKKDLHNFKVVDPLFSVIMRTTGNRNQKLERALISLVGQKYSNFEVIIVLSSTSIDTWEELNLFVENLWCFRQLRPKIVWCNAIGRVAPLNTGLLVSTGKYVTFLDDDDYALSNWLSNFDEIVKKSKEKCVARQQVACAVDATDSIEYGSTYKPLEMPQVSNFTFEYNRTWSFFESILGNFTPFMAFAVPRELDDRKDIIFFDDRMEMAEDWNYLMLHAMELPVLDHNEIGAVYNKLEYNSRKAEFQSLWNFSYDYVISKMDSLKVTMRPGWLVDFLGAVRMERSLPNETHSITVEVESLQSALRDARKAITELSVQLDSTESARKQTEIELSKWLKRSVLYMMSHPRMWLNMYKSVE